jgi:hypothetical protein
MPELRLDHMQKKTRATLQTYNLPVILYGSETLCLTLREEHGLTAFENKMLRIIVEMKRTKLQQLVGNCIKHNDTLG